MANNQDEPLWTSDDLIQRDGADYTNGLYYPEQDIEDEEKDRTEAAILASSYPIIDNVANWFKDAINECDSIDNIETAAMKVNGVMYTRTVSLEGQILAYQLLKQLLEDKSKEFGEFGEGQP